MAVLATEAQWRVLRATTMDVAARAAFLGYASDTFGIWRISAQRRGFGHGVGRCPAGETQVVLTFEQGHNLVRKWVAEVPATALAWVEHEGALS